MEQKWKVQALPSSKITAPAWKKYNSYGKGTTSPEHHKYVTSVVSPVSLTTAQLPSLIAITELLKKVHFYLTRNYVLWNAVSVPLPHWITGCMVAPALLRW